MGQVWRTARYMNPIRVPLNAVQDFDAVAVRSQIGITYKVTLTYAETSFNQDKKISRVIRKQVRSLLGKLPLPYDSIVTENNQKASVNPSPSHAAPDLTILPISSLISLKLALRVLASSNFLWALASSTNDSNRASCSRSGWSA